MAALRALVDAVGSLEDADDDGERIDQIAVLEELKRAACAAQARLTDAFARSQRQAQIEAGVRSGRRHGAWPTRSRGRGVSRQPR